MTQSESTHESQDDEDLQAVYGDPIPHEPLLRSSRGRRDFKPWHHPVKQIVRSEQWAALTRKLLANRASLNGQKVLKYFTLPGPDFLDVKVLATVCEPANTRIEYFGFDAFDADADEGTSAPISVEAALRQSGKTTASAVVYPDRLEDIAVPGSHAAQQLSMQEPFDVINLDACDHLAYVPPGRAVSTFDALECLLRHQLRASKPWLLFVTTRADPELLGNPGVRFQAAITENLLHSKEEFGGALAECLGIQTSLLGSQLPLKWTKRDKEFLKLYAVGLGKFLLQFFHAQPNLPANVELASAYSYRVHSEAPDMLALAYRITPGPQRVFGPSTGGAVVLPDLEPARACYVARQATKLQDLDEALASEDLLREQAIAQTEELLHSAQFDLQAWVAWLANHPTRPIQLSPAAPESLTPQ